MRILGLILVLIGGLALAYHGYVQAARGAPGGLAVPPVVSGIVVAAGLLLVATSGRRTEA